MGNSSVIGIDIGGTKTFCALIDEKFRILHERKFKTSPAEGRQQFTDQLIGALKALSAEAKKQKINVVGAGAAIAGAVDFEERKIHSSPNILFLENFEIGRALKKALGLECLVGNDVQLALYAEHQLGAAFGCKNVLGVFFGTGVGGAAVINGRIYRGASGHGGQVGSILAHSLGGAETTHGKLDQIASKAGIAGAALAMGVKQWAPHLYKETGTDISKVTWGALSRARKQGDTHIDDLIRARMKAAGIALSSVVSFLNPEMLVLGGGLTEEMPKLIVSSLESGLREYLSPEISRDLKVAAAKFKNKAGAIGAAKLAFNKLG